ncbi:Predicted Fe-Mo cluster-binding protein, NifX family [Tangfeifania diversioriginum]|uniref:Predicted Fe-Mo cluster-binding protein, NifX family n=1 Tax=Tangfeifania diversioriginum TaxID=1168035 RepID=A0A1M6LN94_9BACT|nr:NifB/NifX family molybdenum-iron cluster-binding protein [Tangfeifania diversioriginum]SHJ72657.1 Predicted Fe-Mo cluster-binding protein, NifX family [Tangfeifania diversioriginum]
MKIAITSEKKGLRSKFDLRFGRAGWFCIYDTENGEVIFTENENKDANGGAGTKTAEKMAELNVSQIISGDFGPKAKALLEKFKIQMVILDEGNKTINEIIERLKNKSTINSN